MNKKQASAKQAAREKSKRLSFPVAKPDDYVRLGDKYFKEHNYALAIECYKKALTSDSNCAKAYKHKVAAYRKILAHSPNNVEARTDLADCYNRLATLNPNESKWAKLAGKHAGFIKSEAKEWFNKARTHYHLNQLEEALSCYNQAIELNPKLATAWFNKALTHRHLNQLEEAISCYTKALELNPKYANAWNNKARTHYHLNQLEETLSCYNNSLKLSPDQPELKQAIKRIESTLQLTDEQKKERDTWVGWGNECFWNENFGEAANCYKNALKLDPNNENILVKIEVTKGDWNKSANQYAEALKFYNNALAYAPDDRGILSRVEEVEGRIKAQRIADRDSHIEQGNKLVERKDYVGAEKAEKAEETAAAEKAEEVIDNAAEEDYDSTADDFEGLADELSKLDLEDIIINADEQNSVDNEYESAVAQMDARFGDDLIELKAITEDEHYYTDEGDRALKENNYAEALAFYNHALKFNQHNTKAWLGHARACFELRDYDATMESFVALAEENPVEKNQLKVVKICELVLNQKPDHMRAHINTAEAYRLLGQSDKAAQYYSKLAVLNSAREEYWHEKARLAAIKPEYEKGDEELAEFQCPKCAASLLETDTLCHACGIAFASKDEEEADIFQFECPECGTRASETDKSCPGCGVAFEYEDEEDEEETTDEDFEDEYEEELDDDDFDALLEGLEEEL